MVNSGLPTTEKKSHVCVQETNYSKEVSYKIQRSLHSHLLPSELPIDHKEWQLKHLVHPV